MKFPSAILIYIIVLVLTFGFLCYFTNTHYLSTLDFLQLVLALFPVFASIGIYMLSRTKYSPNLLFRMSGEQQGEPIPLNQKKGSYLFGVSTQNALKTIIDEVWVYFRMEELSLGSARGEVELTVDRDYPAVVHFKGPMTVVNKHWQGFWLSYEVEKGIEKLSLRLAAKGHLEETEIKFPFDFISPKRNIVQRTVNFEVRSGEASLLKDGFKIGPGEGLSSTIDQRK
jgi:hypothetical protein